MTETEWDDKLGIQTCGREDYQEDEVHYPYEPTPYSVLERLAGSGYISQTDCLLDYGCGKGRVPVFFSKMLGCSCLGIEFDRILFNISCENKKKSGSEEASIYYSDAETYPVPTEVTRCFFFNPFGEQILRCALNRIVDSYYADPREILLFFYYPEDSQVALLMTIDELMFVDELSCVDLFPGRNERERILIFEVTG